MRSIVFATVMAAGLGMLGTSAASATPAAGLTLGSVADTLNATENVQYRRGWRGDRGWRGGRGWRGNRGWSGGPRCRLRCNPYGRCWRVCW